MLPGRFLLPLLALCSVVAAVQPRPDRGLIREQQQTQWEQLAEADEDLDSHRFLDSLSSGQEMSCPSSKPQGGRSSCNDNTLAPRSSSSSSTRPVSACLPVCCCPCNTESGEPKIEWPELVGKTADEAKAAVEKEAPGFTIQVIGHDMMATADYRCERIRIWLGKDNRVSQPPRVG